MKNLKIKMKNDNVKLKIREKFLKLKGANMDIDLITDTDKISWKQDKCPWNEKENSNKHKCAIKNISICKYFKGIQSLDTVICAYSKNKK